MTFSLHVGHVGFSALEEYYLENVSNHSILFQFLHTCISLFTECVMFPVSLIAMNFIVYSFYFSTLSFGYWEKTDMYLIFKIPMTTDDIYVYVTKNKNTVITLFGTVTINRFVGW